MPGTLQVLPGGVLSGRGTIHGNTINGGRLQPGHSPGIITIDGDYTQSADGSLEIEVGGLTPGTGHDQVQVSGQASLDGAFEFPIVNGFVPQAGMAPITFLTAGSVTGFPKTVTSPNLRDVSPNVGFQVVKHANDLQLFFVEPTPVGLWMPRPPKTLRLTRRKRAAGRAETCRAPTATLRLAIVAQCSRPTPSM